jgi:hypothetical protein
MVMAGGCIATLGDDGSRTAETADVSVVVTDRCDAPSALGSAVSGPEATAVMAADHHAGVVRVWADVVW